MSEFSPFLQFQTPRKIQREGKAKTETRQKIPVMKTM